MDSRFNEIIQSGRLHISLSVHKGGVSLIKLFKNRDAYKLRNKRYFTIDFISCPILTSFYHF
jgi:hypothetical protein